VIDPRNKKKQKKVWNLVPHLHDVRTQVVERVVDEIGVFILVAKPSSSSPGTGALPVNDARRGQKNAIRGGTGDAKKPPKRAREKAPSQAVNKKPRVGTSMGKQSEAVQLGYTAGTIENAAYALLSERGAAGMTVDAIVAAAPKRRLYTWDKRSKTPGNSVTASLGQDRGVFKRIAPYTYVLRCKLKGGGKGSGGSGEGKK